MSSPTPRHLRIGVRNKGCAGMSYHLDYVDKPGRFDEIVEQDDVRVLIDSKALFSIIGSEMDWQEDLLSAKFVFRSELSFPSPFLCVCLFFVRTLSNQPISTLSDPNIKEQCGCGESFLT
jgi:iron-sulfur cluster assembly accessory protein